MPEVTARIEIPMRTILKVLLVLAALWFFARIGPVLAQLFAGILLAMALHPPVARLQRRGLAKGQAVAAVFGGLIAVVAVVLWFLIPAWIDEGQTFVDELPTYVDEGAYWLDDNVPWLYERLEAWAERQSGADESVTGSTEEVAEEVTEEGNPVGTGAALSVGQSLGAFLGTAAVALVLAIYFLVDGDRAFRWLSRDLSPPMVGRVRGAAPALCEIVSTYAAHQIRTSVLSGVFTYVVLAVLDVPSALILATIAAVAEAVPLIGVVMAAVPAAIVALTEGWQAALAVVILFVAYQVFENYVLVPRLLGQRLHLSSFGMLMAVLIGWKLAGLVGALLALPTAAALLVVERVWLDEEEPDRDRDETEAPGPGAIAAAAVAVAAEAVGDNPPDSPEDAGEPRDPALGDEPLGPSIRPEAPAPGSRPAGDGTGRRRRRTRAGHAAPEPTSD